jgi:hypothetical protein
MPELTNEQLAPNTAAEAPNSVSWTASEYVAHHKSTGWFMLVAMAALALAALVYLLTHDFISTAVIIVGAVVFSMYGARPPRELQYELDHSSLKVGDKHYALTAFRSFSLVPEGAFTSILFMPLKRFSPPLSIYFAPEDQEKIVAVLATQLPMENRQHDWIDRMMQRIGF